MSLKKSKSSLGASSNANSLVISLVLMILFFSPLPAFAWGPLGHKAICDAAWRASEPDIQDVLANTAKRMGYRTYAESCLWADDIRGDKSYSWAKPLHYMNVARGATSVSASDCKAPRGQRPSCVWQAIDYYDERWRDTSLSQEQRDQALLLLSHFVGDIHQPLHVAYRDDRGGTRQKLTFEGKLMSLHSLWDSGILYCGTRARWRDLGKQLFRGQSRYDSSQLGKVDTWAEESFALTRLIYANMTQRLPRSYCDKFHPLAVARLELASLRLADLFKGEALGGDRGAYKVQSAPNLIERFSLLLAALWKSILTLLP